MNIQDDQSTFAFEKFAIGQPVPRSEDPVLVRGAGRYTDDISIVGQAFAVMVRSSHAHGHIRTIDVEAARTTPGVLAVYTAADLAAAGYGALRCRSPLKNRDGSPMGNLERPVLASGKVRFLGDPLVCVVAETVAQAKDAAEAIIVEIDPLPAVIDASAAAQPDAPQLADTAPGNLVLDYHFGDSDKVAEAFARAAHVAKVALRNNRLIPNPMEPRAAIATYDSASGRFTLQVPAQSAAGMQGQIASLLNVAPDKVRVLIGNVGGSFGLKAAAFPEYLCVLHAARALGRPVKWTDERSSSFLSDTHGRDNERLAELALDAEGRFIALRLTGYANMGGYVSFVGPLPSCVNAVKNVVGVYRTPLVEVETKCMLTTTAPVAAYRGAGRPEGNYFMERLIDVAARETGIDRVELRRRNHIRPSQLPYRAASEQLYDSGDFPALFKRALELADWKGFAKRRREAKKRGKLRGIGLGSYLKVTAPPSKEMGGLRFEADGAVTITTGTLDQGQGHATPFAQVLASRLGIPPAKVRLVQGDSDALLAGGGTGGSRSITASGAAILEASDRVIERGKTIAAAVLEASPADIEFAAGRFTIAGTDRAIGILDLAARLKSGIDLPEGTPSSLDVDHVIDGVPSAFPNGCHVAEVEVDPDTGVVEMVGYWSVNDFGTVVNPLLVEGQVHGGVVQGIGQVLHERVVYDADGQLLTGSFVDYGMPRAGDIPDIVAVSHPVPATTNPLGTKGCGEAGCAGALVCIPNAIVDALAEFGVTHIEMPVTPEAVWRAIHDARTRATAA